MKSYSDDIEARLTGRHKKCIEVCGEVLDKTVLNIGCYNGWFEKAMLEKGCKEVVGVDINDKFLELSRKNVREDILTKFTTSVLEEVPRGILKQSRQNE